VEIDQSQGETNKITGVPKPQSAYNRFVQEQSKQVRQNLIADRKAKSMPTKVPQADVLKECARLWKERKALL
jgi:FKBP-type peptidyl-prolyl cis-trans isomerase (trigger factor)